MYVSEMWITLSENLSTLLYLSYPHLFKFKNSRFMLIYAATYDLFTMTDVYKLGRMHVP
jgi:hypothetical protein